MLDVNKLGHFLAVYETGHFARAADQLGLSQPAVSKSIKSLEDQLQVKLFERGQFGAEATAFAHSLARRARLIMTEQRLATAELDAMRGARKGVLTIGVGISFTRRILPEAILRFSKRWPDVLLRLETGMSAVLFPQLLRGEVEFVVSAPPTNFKVDEELRQEGLFDEVDNVVVNADHPLTRIKTPTLQDCAHYRWAVSRQNGMLDRVVRVYLEAGLEPPSHFLETNCEVITKVLLKKGDFLCLMGRELYPEEREAGAFTSLKIPEFTSKRRAYITSRKRGTHTTPAKNMLALIKAVVRAG